MLGLDLLLWELLDCSTCDPWVGVRLGPPFVCASFCDMVFKACLEAYFSVDMKTKLLLFPFQLIIHACILLKTSVCLRDKPYPDFFNLACCLVLEPSQQIFIDSYVLQFGSWNKTRDRGIKLLISSSSFTGWTKRNEHLEFIVRYYIRLASNLGFGTAVLMEFIR